MATQRLTMRKIREILRQKLALGDVAVNLGVSIGAISKIIGEAGERGLTLEAVRGMSDEELERALYGSAAAPRTARPLPDYLTVHTERRRPGVTLALLHEEYLKAHPDGYRYTQFCDLYRAWVKRRGLTMRIDHVAGDKGFVDDSGDKLYIVDAQTGECRPVELFVGALGASSYTFADVTMTQTGPDQLKSGVTRSCWYDPQIQRTYEAMAEHYGTTVMPARPGNALGHCKAKMNARR